MSNRHNSIMRAQLAATGLCLADHQALVRVSPWAWAGPQDAFLDVAAPGALVNAVARDDLTLRTFGAVEAETGREFVVMARSADRLAERITELTGMAVAEVRAILPPPLPQRAPGVRMDVAPADPIAEFDLAEALAALPPHQCARRQAGLSLIEIFWKVNPETYDPTVYSGDEKERRRQLETLIGVNAV